MKKLTLDLDALTVDSFDTDAAGGEGTVVGQEMAPTRHAPSCFRTGCCPETWNCTVGC